MYDLFIIGGGINGCGIAADAAERGLKTGLAEMNDLASATSGGSSKLIHGGLRYLEHYEFSLVRKALSEREILLNKAPHLIKPMRFRIPLSPLLRPAWMIRIGLYLYDHLAKRSVLPGSTSVAFDAESPLKPQYKQGFEYSDAHTDDGRLVLANALQAKACGADIHTYTRCIDVKRHTGYWTLTLESQDSQERIIVKTKTLVNATGPWCSDLFGSVLPMKAPKLIRKVKGSHIVVPALTNKPYAYLMQNDDKRVVFVIPYLGEFSLIGTTDVDYPGEPSKVAIDDSEIDYLLDVTNRYFKQSIRKDDILQTYSAVRPLMDEEIENPQAVTRDYHLEVTKDRDLAPLVSVFGGKLTTYRLLALGVMKALKPYFPDLKESQTATSVLPGGMPYSWQQAQLDFEWMPLDALKTLHARHGSRVPDVLEGAKTVADLGTDFGHGLYEQEIDFMMDEEWAMTAEDILHRRTHAAYHLDAKQQQAVADYVKLRLSISAA
jgi:glycerol-3-phosphate dehydrogenase